MKEFFNDETVETKADPEVQEKKATIFDYLQDITTNKRGTVPELKDPDMKVFNSYMILRFLSLDEGYLPVINIINAWQDSLTKKEMYKLLLNIIPRSRKFLKYPKQEKNTIPEEHIELLARYFRCSKEQSMEYLKLKLMSENDVQKIKMLYGGRI